MKVDREVANLRAASRSQREVIQAQGQAGSTQRST